MLQKTTERESSIHAECFGSPIKTAIWLKHHVRGVAVQPVAPSLMRSIHPSNVHIPTASLFSITPFLCTYIE